MIDAAIISERLEQARATLAAHDQSHLLRFADSLSSAQLDQLLSQIESIDFEELDGLIERHVRHPALVAPPRDLNPAKFYPRPPTETYDVELYRRVGEELIRAGKVAAFTVAGGQGTRLGWNGPKGTYPASVVTGKPLFRMFAEQILATQRTYGVTILWYIMTSPMNDADTRAFFADNNCFGLRRANIHMFPQGVMPALDKSTGKVLLEPRDSIALSPDGHGGSIKALRSSGAVEAMAGRGIEHISYFQVDNPNVRVIDPLFIGLHASAPDSSAQFSSKMVAKTDPAEKVGVFCTSAGRTIVIEYSDLPQNLATARDEIGELKYRAANIAVHVIGRQFVEQLTENSHEFGLPLHRALKKVSHVDIDSGRVIEPAEPNAVKLETFVFDAMTLAKSSIILETDRVSEFAPIKNASGADSPATSHQLQSDRAAKWLEARGVEIPWDDDGHVRAAIEISPLTALEPSDLMAADLPARVEAGQELLL